MKAWLIWFVAECKYNWLMFIPMIIYAVWFELSFCKLVYESQKNNENKNSNRKEDL